jgi:hypothetical protein
MRNIMVMTAVALVACSSVSRAQTGPAPQERPTAAAGTAAGDGLSDLDAMTFGCPKAALNAAAREAAKVPSQGTYQFSFFRIVSDSHHAAYEIHFKSNYEGEAELKYCVAVYCQQGWDPKTTKTTVRSLGSEKPKAGAAHGADCADKPAPVKRGVKR